MQWMRSGGFSGATYYDAGDAVRFASEKSYGLLIISIAKTGTGTLLGSAQFLTALAYSAPAFERAIGRKGIVIWLDSLKAGLQAAAASEGERVLAKASMRRIGAGILRLGGWQVTVALIALDILIYAIESDALEKWCESNRFGKVQEGWILGFGASSPQYKTLKEQDEAFGKAIGEVTSRPA
ncbi:hypothetical protein [Xanthomonas oryzae]|uniref:hypothetical protein n=1 Tax=Xanthomonas oryzae TaxID=347 RepID=UPI003D16F789